MDQKEEESARELVEDLNRRLRIWMRKALLLFYMDPRDIRNREDVLNEVKSAYQYNTICFTTGSINDQYVFCPDRVYVPEQSGDAYTVYTEQIEEESLWKVLFHISWRDLLRMAAKTEGIIGILVNPIGRNSTLLITRKELEEIIHAADEAIRGHTPQMEEDLEKYRVWSWED